MITAHLHVYYHCFLLQKVMRTRHAYPLGIDQMPRRGHKRNYRRDIKKIVHSRNKSLDIGQIRQMRHIPLAVVGSLLT